MQNARTTTDAVLLGQQAADELAEALKLAGITLPSLRGGFPVVGRPHVELGGCSAELASRLADWIRRHA